jgi:hypothetical protein
MLGCALYGSFKIEKEHVDFGNVAHWKLQNEKPTELSWPKPIAHNRCSKTSISQTDDKTMSERSGREGV